MVKRLFGILALLAVLLIPISAGAAPGTSSDTKTGPGVDQSYAVVQLKGDPLATDTRTKPAQGKKIDFNSATVKSRRAQLSALRNDFKAWLRVNAPSAQVTGEFDTALNAVSVKLNGEALTTVARAPQAQRAEYGGLYYPAATDPDLAIIKAEQAWAQKGGAANAGTGIKVAIVDSGIDTTHPCFSDAGYPAQTQLGDRRFTNNKVIAAKVFYNKAGNQGQTAEAIDSHGTHVAGTVACNFQTPATVDGVSIPYGISGVAPRALLGNYNVFPGTVGNARSEDILNALEAAYADGFDVANMSLGGGASGAQDLLTVAVDNLDAANMVVAVAAGNDGPGYYTVGSPGSAARALTAGASAVGHRIRLLATVAGASYEVVLGDFGKPTSTVSGPLAVVSDAASIYGGLSTACSPLAAGSLAGKVALISRGDCDFAVKVRHAQQAGAIAALVVNREPGVFAMGGNDEPNQPTIPAYMVDLAAREVLMGSQGATVTFPATGEYAFSAALNDRMADFSSQGPTDVDYRVKPDVVAPGANVLSSVPANSCAAPPCFAFFQGTSMATPHLAGSAAIVLQQRPGLSAAQVRSAIVNTADQGVLTNYLTGALENDVNVVGAGRENLLSAVGARAALDPVSVSFGAVPSGAGQTKTFAVTVTNISAAQATYALTVGPSTGTGVSYTVSPSSVTLAPGASQTVTVTLSSAKGASLGGHQAQLKLSAGGQEVAHGVIFTFVK